MIEKLFLKFHASTASTAILLGALALANACAPVNYPGTEKSPSSRKSLTSLSSATTGVIPIVEKAPCGAIDSSDPQKEICSSCYAAVLAAGCPNKTDPDQCEDPIVRAGFIQSVNICLSNTVQAGFLCNVSCSVGQVLDPTTCTCGPPKTRPVGS